jgi:hypothetical protein
MRRDRAGRDAQPGPAGVGERVDLLAQRRRRGVRPARDRGCAGVRAQDGEVDAGIDSEHVRVVARAVRGRDAQVVGPRVARERGDRAGRDEHARATSSEPDDGGSDAGGDVLDDGHADS